MNTSTLITRLAVAATTLGGAGSALAHPGHGRVALDTLQRTITHWLTEPEHVATIGLVVAVAVALVVHLRRGSAE